MKKYILSIALLLSAITMSGQEAHWEQLFNGKDLKGWKRINGTADYKIAEGTITGISKIGTPNTFLTTEKKYGDFILEFDFKVDDGLNSGVQLRSQSTKDYENGRVHGYQFEIDPSTRAWTGGIYDEARRGWLYTLASNPEAQQAFKHEEWNKARIEAIGNSIRTWVNGVACANIWDDVDPSGFIALQVHNIADKKDEDKTVSWKNIRICTTDVEKYRTPAHAAAIEINAIANTLSPTEKENKWTLLWDGKTTSGWRGYKSVDFPQKGWVIYNGMLKVLKSDGSESTNGGDIITNRKYTNFVLTVDFKITEGANSGIKYFVDPELNKGSGSAIGCEYQILDDLRHKDAKMGVGGNRTLGSLYDLIPALQGKPFRANEFNTATIVVKNNHVEHWLNGVKIVEYERNTQMWNALVAYSKYKSWANYGNSPDGHILLQDHGDEVWFRNIKIKEL